MPYSSRKKLAAILVSGVVANAAAGCGSQVAGSDSDGGQSSGQTLTVMMFPGQTYRLPLKVAQHAGYLADQGISIEEVVEPSNMTGPQGLRATEADIGIWATTDMVLGWQAGYDVAFFCGNLPFLETTLLVAPDSSLPSTQAGDSWEEVLGSLSGKTVGIQTPIGSGMHKIFDSVLDAHGITDVAYITTGVDPSVQAASLKRGNVDVIQASPSTTQQLIAEESAKPILFMPDGPPEYAEYYGSAWAASREWLEKNPRLAQGFCSSLERALSYIADDTNAATVEELLSEDLGVEPAVAKEVRTTFHAYSTDIQREPFQKTLDNFVKLGILKPQPRPTYDAVVWSPE